MRDKGAEPKAVAHAVSYFSQWGFRVWITSVLGVTLVFALQSQYTPLIGPLSNVLPAAAAAASFGTALLCFLRYGHGLRKPFELVWFSFTLGTGLWVVAELSWAVYYFVLNVSVPYPSIADVFYIGGYIPMLAGLVLYLTTFRVAMSRSRIAVALLVIVVAIAIAMAFVLPIEFAQDEPAITTFTDLLYPLLDLALFSLAVVALAIFIGGSISKWWVLFAAGSVIYVIGDEFFLYQFAAGNYYNGSIDDLIFILGYLTFALAFHTHRKAF